MPPWKAMRGGYDEPEALLRAVGLVIGSIAVRHAGIMAWLRSDAIRSQPGRICSRGRVIVCIIGRAP